MAVQCTVWRLPRAGSLGRLQRRDEDLPEPGPGEARIRVEPHTLASLRRPLACSLTALAQGSCAEPVPEPIACPHGGKEVEIFTNEQSMRCYFCGGLGTREKQPSCFDWCRYADKCISEIESASGRRH